MKSPQGGVTSLLRDAPSKMKAGGAAGRLPLHRISGSIDRILLVDGLRPFKTISSRLKDDFIR